MRCDRKIMRLYAVTDRAWTGKTSLYEQVEAAIRGGVTCVQLREKELPYKDFLKEAITIKKICSYYNVTFIINDNVDIAVDCDADGVHIGQEDMKIYDVRKILGDEKIIGLSVHNFKEALDAEKNGADYIGVGAVFNTRTKKNVKVIDIKSIKNICENINIPVVAIGGLKKDNISVLKGSGIDGVAIVSEIFGAKNIEEECRNINHILENVIEEI